jgi:hypothetical protein
MKTWTINFNPSSALQPRTVLASRVKYEAGIAMFFADEPGSPSTLVYLVNCDLVSEIILGKIS